MTKAKWGQIDNVINIKFTKGKKKHNNCKQILKENYQQLLNRSKKIPYLKKQKNRILCIIIGKDHSTIK